MCIRDSGYLDKQREKVLPVLEHLVSVVNTLQKAASLMASDDVTRNIELQWLQISPLINLLHDIASQICRSDGWANLAHAGKLARIQMPDDVANMKEIYGYDSFKKLLIASELFEILDGPLLVGGVRTFYRVRPK